MAPAASGSMAGIGATSMLSKVTAVASSAGTGDVGEGTSVGTGISVGEEGG